MVKCLLNFAMLRSSDRELDCVLGAQLLICLCYLFIIQGNKLNEMKLRRKCLFMYSGTWFAIEVGSLISSRPFSWVVGWLPVFHVDRFQTGMVSIFVSFISLLQ